MCFAHVLTAIASLLQKTSTIEAKKKNIISGSESNEAIAFNKSGDLYENKRNKKKV